MPELWTQIVYKKNHAEVLQFEPGSGIIGSQLTVGVSAAKKEVFFMVAGHLSEKNGYFYAVINYNVS